MEDMLKDFMLGEHLLLVGNQVCEYLLLQIGVCRSVVKFNYCTKPGHVFLMAFL